MFRARMKADVPHEIAPGYTVRSIWSQLAEWGELPKLVGPTPPYETGDTWWGWLPDGIFFVTAMKITASGFSCRITLHPCPKKDWDTRVELLISWLGKNLFLGKATGKQDLYTYDYVFQSGGLTFTLKNWTQLGFAM